MTRYVSYYTWAVSSRNLKANRFVLLLFFISMFQTSLPYLLCPVVTMTLVFGEAVRYLLCPPLNVLVTLTHHALVYAYKHATSMCSQTNCLSTMKLLPSRRQGGVTCEKFCGQCWVFQIYVHKAKVRFALGVQHCSVYFRLQFCISRKRFIRIVQ